MEADELAGLLRDNGYRATDARLQVYGALAGADAHVTAEQLLDSLTGAGTTLSSVYRALAVLEELGLARVTRLGDDAARWELDHPDEHFHVVCDDCGGVEHHRGSLVELVTHHLRDDHGFEVSDVSLLVHGRCAECRSQTPPVPLA